MVFGPLLETFNTSGPPLSHKIFCRQLFIVAVNVRWHYVVKLPSRNLAFEAPWLISHAGPVLGRFDRLDQIGPRVNGSPFLYCEIQNR